VGETLLKAVAGATGLSRRRAFEAIREGRVTQDGLTVRHPSGAYGGGALALDGVAVSSLAPLRIYLLMNKPAGVISSAADDLGRETVLDLIPPELAAPGLHSVGRLDRDTTGLLMLTNDGDFTYRLTHPKHEVEKEYWLIASPSLDDRQIDALSQGVKLDGKARKPLLVRRLPEPARFQLTVVIREGRNRQIRRMVQAVGGRVTRLHRVREGPLVLGELPEGRVRRLTAAEVKSLKWP
jgi:23S rRNA pseudouridine2605 synthase